MLIRRKVSTSVGIPRDKKHTLHVLGIAQQGTPAILMLPDFNNNTSTRTSSNVVFPHPLGATSPTTCPGSRENDESLERLGDPALPLSETHGQIRGSVRTCHLNPTLATNRHSSNENVSDKGGYQENRDESHYGIRPRPKLAPSTGKTSNGRIVAKEARKRWHIEIDKRTPEDTQSPPLDKQSPGASGKGTLPHPYKLPQ